ncbi:hypothetical protein [Asanoa ferruginea]|nr:hypothetical protein [Asanoa ferruginea]
MAIAEGSGVAMSGKTACSVAGAMPGSGSAIPPPMPPVIDSVGSAGST